MADCANSTSRLRNSAREHPHRPALVDATTQWSHCELAARAFKNDGLCQHSRQRDRTEQFSLNSPATDASRVASWAIRIARELLSNHRWREP